MLDNLLKSVSPEVLATIIRNNPDIVIAILQRTKMFVTIGQALSTKQQVVISTNIAKLDDYFQSREGKSTLSLLADEFTEFINKKAPTA